MRRQSVIVDDEDETAKTKRRKSGGGEGCWVMLGTSRRDLGMDEVRKREKGGADGEVRVWFSGYWG